MLAPFLKLYGISDFIYFFKFKDTVTFKFHIGI